MTHQTCKHPTQASGFSRNSQSLARRFRLATLGLAALAVIPATFLALLPISARADINWVNTKLPAGEGLKHKVLNSKALGHDVGYVVWTPANFDPSGKTRYPVVYFLHGAGGNETSDSGGFSSIYRDGMNKGHAPAAICVFPNGGLSGYGGRVEKMIVSELIPQIDRDYPTRKIGAARAVAGFSMGGGGGVGLALRNPTLFRAVGSWGGRLDGALLDVARSNRQPLSSNKVGMLFVNGDNDGATSFRPLAQTLTSFGLKSEVLVLTDTGHNLGHYHARSADRMIKFLGVYLRDAANAN